MTSERQKDPGRDSPVWMIRQFDCMRRQAAMMTFADVPLADPSQHFMLFFIERGTDCGKLPSQREIARSMRLSPATVTASLKAMEKHGLICRKPDETDMRVNRVAITEVGRQVATECRHRMERLEENMFRGFRREELVQLTGYFLRMGRNLRSICGEEESFID